MRLVRLSLAHFRSYTKETFAFPSQTTVLVGKNAVGKTNVLEAIELLSRGESFRAERIEEMVAWDSEVSHVEGILQEEKSGEDGEAALRLHITLTRGKVQGKRVSKRLYKVNGVPRRKQDFVSQLLTVAFLPQHLRLIEGSPSRRRQFLDDVLTQTNNAYRRSLASYEKGLRRRNKVLMAIREGQTHRQALTFWNELLLSDGRVLSEARQQLVAYFNAARLAVTDKGLAFSSIQVDYKPSILTPQRLDEYYEREVASGHTLVGPHKDDFVVTSRLTEKKQASWEGQLAEGRDLALYGSRGEQRMAVLLLKLKQLAYITEQTKTKPLLLLDDIFSELNLDEQAAYCSHCSILLTNLILHVPQIVSITIALFCIVSALLLTSLVQI